MNTRLEELIDKWRDIALSTDDRAERTLAEEAVDDFQELLRIL